MHFPITCAVEIQIGILLAVGVGISFHAGTVVLMSIEMATFCAVCLTRVVVRTVGTNDRTIATLSVGFARAIVVVDKVCALGFIFARLWLALVDIHLTSFPWKYNEKNDVLVVPPHRMRVFTEMYIRARAK